jgi:hypothetical protein
MYLGLGFYVNNPSIFGTIVPLMYKVFLCTTISYAICSVLDGGPPKYRQGLGTWAEHGCGLYMQLLQMYEQRWQSNMVQATFGRMWIQCEALW